MKSLRQKATSYSKDQDAHRKLLDCESRTRKAEKIRAVLRAAGALSKDTRVLDIGCSHGHILKNLAQDSGYCVGVDMDREAERQTASNIAYILGDGEQLPFAAQSFDVVICNHVYEHTDNPPTLAAEILRLLKPTGVCYFAGPNKYSLIEPHYHLPFLSWLPQGVANSYVRLCRKGDAYLVRPYSYRQLVDLLGSFNVEDYTPRIIEHPERFHIQDLIAPGSVLQKMARLSYTLCRGLFPTFIFLLRRPR